MRNTLRGVLRLLCQRLNLVTAKAHVKGSLTEELVTYLRGKVYDTSTQAAVYETLEQLGVRRHPTKGYQDPTRRLSHLGLEVDTVRGVFRVPTDRAARLRRDTLVTLHE